MTGFLLAGIGGCKKKSDKNERESSDDEPNFYVIEEDSDKEFVKECFKKLTSRQDIAIVIINSFIREMILETISQYNKQSPILVTVP